MFHDHFFLKVFGFLIWYFVVWWIGKKGSMCFLNLRKRLVDKCKGKVFCFCVLCFVSVHCCWTIRDLCWAFLLFKQPANELHNCSSMFWLSFSFNIWCHQLFNICWVFSPFCIDVFFNSMIFCCNVTTSRSKFSTSSFPFFCL